VLFTLAICPRSRLLLTALLLAFISLLPLADRYALKSYARVLHDPGTDVVARANAAKACATTFFWSTTAEQTLNDTIKASTPPTLIFAARRAAVTLTLRADNDALWAYDAQDDSNYDSDTQLRTHSYLIRKPLGGPLAIVICPADLNIWSHSGLGALTALLANENATGLLFANFSNLFTAEPIFEPIGTDADFRKLSELPPRQSFNIDHTDIYKNTVLPRLRRYKETTR
jgi:hypothetical protein